MTTRSRILSALRRQYPDAVTVVDLRIMLDCHVTRQRLANIINELMKTGAIESVSRGAYRYMKE